MPEESLKTKILELIFGERSHTMLALTVLLLGVGLVGQTKWFPLIPDEFRWAAIGLGVISLLVTIVFFVVDGHARKNKYGVEIFVPTKGAYVDERIEIKGRMGPRPLPAGKELWLLRIYPKRSEFEPMMRVQPDTDGSWTASGCSLGGASEEPRIIGAYVIDESARLLFDYREQVHREHNEWMDKLKVSKDVRNRYLKPIRADVTKQKNMEKCVEVEVKRK
jgi:hypothetical protein